MRGTVTFRTRSSFRSDAMRAWLKDILSFVGFALGVIVLIALTLGRSLVEYLVGREGERFSDEVKTILAWCGGTILVVVFGVCAYKVWQNMRRPVAWNRKDRERS